MRPENPNTIQGGNKMKCLFCNKVFEPITDETVCDECIGSIEELSNGKEENEDD